MSNPRRHPLDSPRRQIANYQHDPGKPPIIVDGESILAKGKARYALQADVEVGIEEITPELAADWLARKAPNRKISEAVTLDYARQMEDDAWDLNGEAIVFDNRGELADGQHRLSAVVMSGATIKSVIVRGIKREAFDTIDTGRGRRLKDFLDRDQYTSTMLLGAVVPQLMHYEREGQLVNTRGGRQKKAAQLPTVKEVLAYLEQEYRIEEIEDAKNYINRLSTRSAIRRVSKAGMIIAYIILARINSDQAGDFFEGVYKGTLLEEGDPVLALRNRLLNSAADGRSLPMHELVAHVFKAWNATRRGRELKILTWKPSVEAFPTPE